jgi:hypothetical protein
LIALSPKFPSLTNSRSGPLCSYFNAPANPLRRQQTGDCTSVPRSSLPSSGKSARISGRARAASCWVD